MYRQHYLDVIEAVLTWDLPDEVLTDAINNQVMQHTNSDDEDVWERYPINSLTFNH